MAIEWERQVNDTGPDLTIVLREAPTAGQRTGDPTDLTGNTVMVRIVRSQDHAVVLDDVAAATGNPGEVTVPISSIITAAPGLYAVQWFVIGGSTRTFPLAPESHHLRVRGTTEPGSPVGVAPEPSPAAVMYRYDTDSADYEPVPSRIFAKQSGEPFPTATTAGDFVIETV